MGLSYDITGLTDSMNSALDELELESEKLAIRAEKIEDDLNGVIYNIEDLVKSKDLTGDIVTELEGIILEIENIVTEF